MGIPRLAVVKHRYAALFGLRLWHENAGKPAPLPNICAARRIESKTLTATLSSVNAVLPPYE
jgi:hypothetical protein